MANLYIFADETGDLGYESENKYFGFGTSTFRNLKELNFAGAFQLRCELEAKGMRSIAGFHASVDSNHTRSEVFNLISSNNQVFDFTFLDKRNASRQVKAEGELYLYKLAWFLHFKHLINREARSGDCIYSICASIKTKSKAESIRLALIDVAQQFGNLKINSIIWNSNSSWGLQIADYGLWAAQRKLISGSDTWFNRYVEGQTKSFFEPWRK